MLQWCRFLFVISMLYSATEARPTESSGLFRVHLRLATMEERSRAAGGQHAATQLDPPQRRSMRPATKDMFELPRPHHQCDSFHLGSLRLALE